MQPSRLQPEGHNTESLPGPPNLMPRANQRKVRRQLSSAEWEELKPIIRRVYIEEWSTLAHLTRVLEQEHGVLLTKRQLTARFTRWGFRKNESQKDTLRKASSGSQINNPTEDEGLGNLVEGAQEASSTSLIQRTSPILEGTRAADSVSRPQLGSIDRTAQTEEIPAILDDDSEVTDIIRTENTEHWSSFEENEPSEISKLIYILKLQLGNNTSQPVLPHSSSPIQEAIEPNYISTADLISSSTSEEETLDTSDARQWAPQYSQMQGALHRLNATQNPMKFAAWGKNLDAFLPSGNVYVYSSPYNEVYPFPISAGINVNAQPQSNRTPTLLNEKEYEASLNALEKMYPENDIRWYQIMKGNAAAKMVSGKYRESEILFRKLVVTSSNIFGPDSVETIDAMCNIAGMIYNQGRYAQAGQFHEQTHQKAARILPSDHPTFLKSYSAKATIAGSLGGNLVAGEDIQRHIVQITLCKMGPKDQLTRQSLQFLAMCLMNAKKFTLCEELLHTVVEIGQAVLDQEQTDLIKGYYARTLQMLCRVLWEQGKYEECERVCQMARAKARSMLHPYHENVLALDYRLASAWRKQGKIRESEYILRDVLERQIASLGESDQDTLRTTRELAQLLAETNRYQESTVFHQKYFRLRVETYGADNKHSFEALDALLKNYEAEGRQADTDTLVTNYLEQLRELRGEDDQQLAQFRKQVADMSQLLQQKAQGEAEGQNIHHDSEGMDGKSLLEDFLEEGAWTGD